LHLGKEVRKLNRKSIEIKALEKSSGRLYELVGIKFPDDYRVIQSENPKWLKCSDIEVKYFRESFNEARG